MKHAITSGRWEVIGNKSLESSLIQSQLFFKQDIFTKELMCAELAGDFHLGDSRQLTDKSLLPFDLVS